ncbi:MAG: hypothetical protein HN334_05660 [Candidatus Cloacimonetes bacterium]|nr:hypothetical protein [Candidatus Cloacimonadota bacterium]
MGTEKFGSFVLFMTIINMAIVVIPGSINLVILRVHSHYEDDRKYDLIKMGSILNLVISLVCAIIIYFGFPFIANSFKVDSIYRIFLLPLMIYMILYNLRETLLIIKRIKLEFKEIAINNIIFGFLFVLIIPLYPIFHESTISIGYFIAIIIAVIIIILKSKKIITSKLISFKSLNEYQQFAPSFAFVAVLELLVMASSRFIISYYKDPTQVAYFFAATSVVQVLVFPFAQIRTILLSFISQKKKIEEFSKKEIKFISFASFIVGLILFVFGLFFGKYMITYLYGIDYYTNSKLVLIIILFGYIFYVFKMYLKNFIILFFKRRILIINVIIMLLINILINIIFVPKYGINAAAIGMSLSIIVSAIMWSIVLYRKLL